MKNRLFRLVLSSVLVALALLAFLFAACSSDGKNDENGGEQDGTSAEEDLPSDFKGTDKYELPIIKMP